MKELNDHSDRELKEALSSGDYTGRKAAIAKEILRRRHIASAGKVVLLFTGIMSTVALGIGAIRRFWGARKAG